MLLGRAEAGEAQAVEPELERAFSIVRAAWATGRDDSMLGELERLLSEVVHGRKGAMLRAANKRLDRFRSKGVKCGAYATADEALGDGCTAVVVGWETLAVLEAERVPPKDGQPERMKLVPHLRPDLRRKWSRVIADEHHQGKGRLADRSAAAHELAALSLHAPWGATGTPVPDRLRDLHAQLFFLDRASAGTSWKWAHRYLHAKPGEFGGLDTKGPHKPKDCELCAARVAELKRRIGSIARVRTRAELAGTLPPFTPVLVRIPSSKAASAAASGAARGMRGIEGAVATAAEAKLPEVVELAVSCLISGGKVVVGGSRVAWVPKALAAIQKALPRGTRERLWSEGVTGAIEPTKRVAVVAEYMARPGPALLVGTMDSIGEAMDLQDTDVSICAQLPYTYKALGQWRGRFTRPGQLRAHTAYFLVAEGTIDEEIEQKVLAKFDAIEEVGADTVELGRDFEVSDEQIVSELQSWLRQAQGIPEAPSLEGIG